MLLTQVDPTNPFLPVGSDILWIVLTAVMFAITLGLPVWAAVTLWRGRDRMETTHILIWAAVIIFAPFVGSLVWLFFGRDLHHVRSPPPVAGKIT